MYTRYFKEWTAAHVILCWDNHNKSLRVTTVSSWSQLKFNTWITSCTYRFLLMRAQPAPTTIAGVSLMFSAGGQLVFTGRQNYFSWTPLQEKLPSTCRLSNQAGKVVFTASQFAQSMALNETSVPHKENNCLNHNQTSIKWPPINRPTFIWWPVPKVLRIFLLYTVIKTSIQWPPLSSSCGQLLAIPRLIYFKFALCLY